MRFLQKTIVNVYSSTSNVTDKLFESRRAVIQNQLRLMAGGLQAWYPFAPLPDDHEAFSPEKVYGRNGLFRNWELGEVPYSAGYVFTPVGGGM
jgi:hypothetical protein